MGEGVEMWARNERERDRVREREREFEREREREIPNFQNRGRKRCAVW